MDPVAAVVLAGTRGEGDPLAAAEGVRHRALLPVVGVPMLLRVVRSLRASQDVASVHVSIDEPAVLDDVAELRDAVRDGSLQVRRSLDSPSRSVLDCLEAIGPQPTLVTTADHALLTPEMLACFLAGALATDADVCVGLVSRTVLEARFPESTRTWLPFRDDDYSGANLFLFRTPSSRLAAAFWRRAESFRKRPWRLVGAFGPVALLLFLLRRLDLDAALERASRSIGATIRAVRMPMAEAAVDVDRPSDLALVSELLESAQSGRSPESAKLPRAGS
jgi:GTP:adenosylcobinamide-phosphate guanylyltransferase